MLSNPSEAAEGISRVIPSVTFAAGKFREWGRTLLPNHVVTSATLLLVGQLLCCRQKISLHNKQSKRVEPVASVRIFCNNIWVG